MTILSLFVATIAFSFATFAGTPLLGDGDEFCGVQLAVQEFRAGIKIGVPHFELFATEPVSAVFRLGTSKTPTLFRVVFEDGTRGILKWYDPRFNAPDALNRDVIEMERLEALDLDVDSALHVPKVRGVFPRDHLVLIEDVDAIELNTLAAVLWDFHFTDENERLATIFRSRAEQTMRHYCDRYSPPHIEPLYWDDSMFVKCIVTDEIYIHPSNTWVNTWNLRMSVLYPSLPPKPNSR